MACETRTRETWALAVAEALGRLPVAASLHPRPSQEADSDAHSWRIGSAET